MHSINQCHVALGSGLLAPWFLALSLLSAPLVQAQSGPDIDPPTIKYEAAAEAGIAGEGQQFKVEVTDDQAVDGVVLFYRRSGESRFQNTPMKPARDSSEFTVTLPTEPGDQRAIEYYFQAKDTAGNRVLRGYAFSPLVLDIEVPGLPEPAVQAPVEPQPVAVNTSSGGSGRKWLWIGVGVLVVGAAGAAALASGDDDPPGSTFTVTIPPPQ